jgi:hypothetical protein
VHHAADAVDDQLLAAVVRVCDLASRAFLFLDVVLDPFLRQKQSGSQVVGLVLLIG